MPPEYWEYRLVQEHFRGDWFTYWNIPEQWIEMIINFRTAELEAANLQSKREMRGKE